MCGGEGTTYNAVAWVTGTTLKAKHPGQRLRVPEQSPANLREHPLHIHTYTASGSDKVPEASCAAPAEMGQGDEGLLSHYLGLMRATKADVLIIFLVPRWTKRGHSGQGLQLRTLQ